MRAISRRTPSKPERITALGVSSMMKSTPVRFSSARMLRPSRPMMRPFMSSAGSWTTETVVSAAWPAASRCMATDEDVAHAAVGVALGLLLDLAHDARRIVAGLVLELLEQRSAWPAPALQPGDALELAHVLARAARRARSRCAVAARARRSSSVRSSARSARRARASIAARRSSDALERPRSLSLARRSTRSPSGRRRAPERIGVDAPSAGRASRRAPVAARRPDEADRQDGRRDHDFHCRSSPRGPGMGPPRRSSVLWSGGPGRASARGAGRHGDAAGRPPLQVAAGGVR